METNVRSFIALLATQRDVITYVIIKPACASMIRTHVGSVSRTALIVPSHMAIMIFVHQFTTLKRYKHWRIPILILIHHLTDQIYLTKRETWWTKIRNGKTRTTCWAITKQSPANDHQGFAVRAMLVHSITIVKIKDVVLGSTNTDQHHALM